jgi:hypothetical protein
MKVYSFLLSADVEADSLRQVVVEHAYMYLAARCVGLRNWATVCAIRGTIKGLKSYSGLYLIDISSNITEMNIHMLLTSSCPKL